MISAMRRIAIDRRTFLRRAAGAGCAAAAAFAFPAEPGAAPPAPPPAPRKSWFDLYGGFRVGLKLDSLRDLPLDKAIAMAQELGIPFAEPGPRLIPLDLSEERLAKIQESFRVAQVRLDAYGVVPFPKGSADVARAFGVAKSLAAFTIAADPDPEVLPELDARAGDLGIRVAVHNGGPGHRFATPEALEPAIRDLSDRIGICIDTANALRAGVDPIELVDLFEKRVLGVHLRDHDAKAGKPTPLGKGSLRLLAFMKALRAIKFQGFFSIEEEGDDPLVRIRAAIETIEKAAKEMPPPELPFPRAGRLPRTPIAPEPKKKT